MAHCSKLTTVKMNRDSISAQGTGLSRRLAGVADASLNVRDQERGALEQTIGVAGFTWRLLLGY